MTDSRLGPASHLDLELSFYGQPCLCELAACVVWDQRGGAGEKGFEGLQLYGVQFMLSTALQKSHVHALFRRIIVDWVDCLELSRILAGENFVKVFRPSASEFDLLLYALAGELDELGRKIQKITGQKS